jgi:hypothetical protein
MREALSAEDELCLCLARGELSPEVRRRALELLDSPLRWDLLLQRAREHQVSPLIYRNLRILEFHGVPPEPRAQLTNAFRANALRNEFLSQELARLLRLLGEAGLRVIPLKGIILAASLYGDPAYRVCTDLDILIPVDETPRALRLLLENGYTSPYTEEFFLKHQFHSSDECPLFPKSEFQRFQLEVHWTLLHQSSKDKAAMQDLWLLAQPQELLGVPAYALTPEWLFLYLAYHASNHKWGMLKWLADLHELCLAPHMNWQQVREKSERFDLDLTLGPALTACSTLFGTPLPPNLPCLPLPPAVRLFPRASDPAETWKTFLFHPRLLKRPSERLRWFAETIFVPRLADHDFLRLPAALNFFYFALRPLRLTFKWGWFFLRTGFHRLRRKVPFSHNG